MEKKDIEEGKGVAWLSYLGIFILIPLLTQKDNPYIKFHIKQGLILLIVSFGWSFIWVFFMFVPFLRVIIWSLSYVVYLFVFVLMIIGITNSLRGKTEVLPVIGKYAEKIKI